MNNVTDTHTVNQWLKNFDLKIVLDSPEKDYRLEYFTAPIKDRITGKNGLIRTYQLIDLVRGGITSSPWDAFNHDKQVILITNLVNFGHYRIAKVICGLEIKCPVCNQTKCFKTWEKIPKRCLTRNPHKCQTPINKSKIIEIFFTENVV